MQSLPLSFEEQLKNELDELRHFVEEAAPMVVEAFDRDNDEEVSLSEVTDGVKILIIQAIGVVDQDGDEKVSPEELVEATDPDTLSDAVMKFYDANGDGELRIEDLKSVEERYRENPTGAIRDWADVLSDAIKNGGNASP